MKHRTLIALFLPMLLILGACASGNRANSGGGPATEAATQDRRDPNLLVEADIANYQNAFDAVRGLRSNWLRTRSNSSFTTEGTVVLYRDGVKMGTTSMLAGISTAEISQMRFFNGIEATQRWGIGHQNGAIYITTKAGRSP